VSLYASAGDPSTRGNGEKKRVGPDGGGREPRRHRGRYSADFGHALSTPSGRKASRSRSADQIARTVSSVGAWMTSRAAECLPSPQKRVTYLARTIRARRDIADDGGKFADRHTEVSLVRPPKPEQQARARRFGCKTR
jgi:hypothetical protein